MGTSLPELLGVFPFLRPQLGRGAEERKRCRLKFNKEVPMELLLHKDLSDKVLGMAFSVHNILGPGLLESAYEGAYCVELARAGLPVDRQRVYPLHYKGELVGAYIADIVIANTIILELKSVSALNKVMEAQLLNYLKLSGLPIGYLMNFNGLRVEWKRFVNQREE
jgi:GxxExxY protein